MYLSARSLHWLFSLWLSPVKNIFLSITKTFEKLIFLSITKTFEKLIAPQN